MKTNIEGRHWAAAALLLVAAAVRAQEEPVGAGIGPAETAADDSAPGIFYATPTVSFDLRDSHRGTSNGAGGALALGWRAADWVSLELRGQYGEMSPATLGGAVANVLLFPLGKGLYFLGGAGYARVKSQPGLQDYAATLYNGGFGYRFGPYSVWGHYVLLDAEALLRVDRHHAVPSDGSPGGALSNFNDGQFNVGVVFPFGPKPHPQAVEPPPPPPQVVPVEEPSRR